MKVAILVQDVSSLGGIEIVSFSLADKLKKAGNDVFFISCKKNQVCNFSFKVFYLKSEHETLSNKDIKKLIDFIVAAKIERMIVQLNSPHKNCLVANICLLKTVASRCKVDVVIHNSPKSFITRYQLYREPILKFLIKSIKTKIIYSPHAKYFFKVISKFCRLITISEGNKAELKKYYGIESVVIHNPYKFIEFDVTTRKKQKNVVWIGRLSEEKNIPFILDSWKKISDKKDWKLQIIGDGPLYSSVDGKTKSDLSIELAGRKSHEDVINILKTSSILLLSSFNEGFPTVVTEAMNFANAIVTVHFDGFSNELLVPEETCLVSEYESSVFAEKLQYLINENCVLMQMQRKCYEKCLSYSRLIEVE